MLFDTIIDVDYIDTMHSYQFNVGLYMVVWMVTTWSWTKFP